MYWSNPVKQAARAWRKLHADRFDEESGVWIWDLDGCQEDMDATIAELVENESLPDRDQPLDFYTLLCQASIGEEDPDVHPAEPLSRRQLWYYLLKRQHHYRQKRQRPGDGFVAVPLRTLNAENRFHNRPMKGEH